MISPSFSLTATERVLPKLALDFTTALLDSRVTFTRAGATATCVDSSGLIVDVAENIPRFDYDPSTLICKGLLIEEQRTNLSLNSVFDGALATPTSWVRLLGTDGASATSTIAPSVGSAWTFTADNDRQAIYQVISVAANTTYSFSVYVEENSNGVGRSSMLGVTNLPSGAAVTYESTSTTAGSRLKGQLVVGATAGTCQFRIGIGVTANANGTVRLSCPQFEAGAFATSYIPTTLLPLTRNADVATMTGTNFSDWFNASEGTFYALWAEGGDSSLYGVLSADDGTTDNYVDIRRQSSTSVRSLVRSGASAIATLALTNNYAANQQLAFVSAYKVDSYAGSVNQSAVNTDSAGAVPVSQNQLQLGTLAGATPYQLNGWLQQLKYWPQRLTNAEVQAFAK